MMWALRTAWLLVCLLCLQLLGCSSYQRDIKRLTANIESVPPEVMLANLQALDGPDRDKVQHLLDLGALKMVCGDLNGAVLDLSSADIAMAEFRAPSVTETLGAMTLSESLRSYPGSPTERVMLHTMAALAYLMQGQRQRARVEMLQADIEMRELATDGSIHGQLAGARFLAGVVYELGGEYDDALISYRKAYKLLKARQEPIPTALARSLLLLTARVGVDEELARYRRQFPQLASAKPPAQELVVIFLDGVISAKQEKVIHLFSTDLDRRLKVALPTYPPSDYRVQPLIIQLHDGVIRSEVIEDLESRVREDLNQALPGITARTIARAVARYQAIGEAHEISNILGSVAGIFLNAMEAADTRSWDLLPSSIQVARIERRGEIRLRGGRLGIRTVPPSDATKQLVIVSSLASTLFTYP